MKKWTVNREMMKSHFDTLRTEPSDQDKGVEQPPIELSPPAGSKTIILPDPSETHLAENDVRSCIQERKSRRKYTEEPLTLEEVSFMLWATQGVRKTVPAYSRKGRASLRTVPSGGARHPFETYLAASNVTGLEPGIYRYSGLSHSLAFLFSVKDMKKKLSSAALEQIFVGKAPVTFMWSCKPYLGEWRYMGESHKVMLLDAGHLCQNMYLSAEALKLGTVAIGAYSQKLVDELLQLDGENEFVVYMAPVGRVFS
ncbi:hypothetical protein CSA37_00040 [Candidatus Fermentibacteria bacterium]|nr:MAG: hypothetical protein CSA37_00040 [Candidatus Fermentibacteria bacterium]